MLDELYQYLENVYQVEDKIRVKIKINDYHLIMVMLTYEEDINWQISSYFYFSS